MVFCSKIDPPNGGKGKKGKVQKGKGLEKSCHTARHPKTDEVAAVAGDITAADRGTAVIRIAAPRTTPQYLILILIIITVVFPSTAISRRSLIVFMPSISTPFPDIAMHII